MLGFAHADLHLQVLPVSGIFTSSDVPAMCIRMLDPSAAVLQDNYTSAIHALHLSSNTVLTRLSDTGFDVAKQAH